MKTVNSNRVIAALLVLVMVMALLPVAAFAADQAAPATITTYLTVFNAGEFAKAGDGKTMYQMPVTVEDLNGDSKFTLDEALKAAHKSYNAEDGYATVWSETYQSSSVTKLWGVETGVVGFYRNDVSTMAVDMEYIEAGDKLTAFIYKDAASWTDRYSFFEDKSGFAPVGGSVTLTLSYWGYDASWNTVKYPAANASIGVYDMATGSFTALENVKTDANGKATITFDKAGTYYVSAKAADTDAPLVPAICTVIVAQDAYWPNFRGNDYNMAITDVELPKSADTTVLKWAVKLGTGWSAAPSVQIIADNALITMVNKEIFKLDLQTGEVLGKGTMDAASSWGYTPPIYAEGLIICPLGGGKLQAFDVNTLESKWLFTDELGGQANTPIAYADGKVYTGFWNGETKDANIVCVDINDGSLVWKKTVPGGCYWAGGVVVGDALIIGSDDGASGFTGDSHLFSLNKDTGDVISDLTLTGCGDQRSTVSYSQEMGRVFLTTKNGYICSAKLDAATGELSDLLTVKHGSAQSTSTPLVYGDKVYYCCGSGVVSSSNGAGNFVVADANTLEMLYTVPLLGYPQASTLLTTAYLETEGKLYFYNTYNGRPGGLTLIKIDPTKTDETGFELEEIYDAKGYEQYCIASPICGPDGTIYYKNDSGYVLAVGSNSAYLTGITGDTGAMTGEFKVSNAEIEWVVPIGTQTVTLTPAVSAGSTYTINGAANAAIALEDGQAAAVIEVVNGNDKRTYTVSIREISNDTTLSGLKVNQANSFSSSSGLQNIELVAGTYYYGAYAATRNWVNVWPDASNANATVKVFAIENVESETAEIEITNSNAGHNRYAIYAADETKPMAIRIVVTAENGDTASYVLVISNEEAKAEGEALLAKIQSDDAAAAADQAAADAVIERINAIGTVTLNSKETIEAARAAYEALTEAQKALVSNLETLTAAESKLAELEEQAAADAANKAAADAVTEKIHAIGTVTLDSKEAIEAARAAYEALTDAQKALVTNLDALAKAESDYAALVKPVEPPATGDSTPIALLMSVLVASMAGIALMVCRKKEIL